MPSVVIILPVHNGLSYVRDAVAALCAYTSRQHSRVRIVDDASDARTAVRNNPAIVIGAAALIGFALARFMKGGSGDRA